MEKSKTSMELFEKLYPPKEIAHNPLSMAEAIGYLNCLVQFVPSVKEEADVIKLTLYCGITSML
jgi:hypothetical protein